MCAQKQDTGPCRGAYNRFAYDQARSTCVPFVYGGCRGNQNNFLTLQECQDVCIRNRGDLQPTFYLSKLSSSDQFYIFNH